MKVHAEITDYELSVASGGDVAFAHHRLETSCRVKAGAQDGGWRRVTPGLQRMGGGWTGCHAHISALCDAMTEKSMFGLRREATPWAEGTACSAS